jgi:AbiV family abortive infection protein
MLPEKAQAHLKKYWSRASDSFKAGDFPLAAFFAITLIEEVGKVVVLGTATLSGELDRKAFRDHREKYAYAVYSTLFVNSRITRVYGILESRFADWFRNGTLFKIRNSALYLEQDGDHLVVPSEAVSRADACLLVCIGGEVLAEIQGRYTGSGPEEWSNVLRQVDQFRDQYLVECHAAPGTSLVGDCR